MTTIAWELPIKTVSEANSSEHWTVKGKRHRVQQFFVRMAFHTLKTAINLPCCVKMTRLGGRGLDAEENLRMAFKWIKDQIGACIFPDRVVTYQKKSGSHVKNKGHADDDPRITWEYAQEKAKKPGVRIEITYEA